MNDWCIELVAAVIRQAVWDLNLIAKTDDRKKVIAEYIKLGSCPKAAKALGMKEQGVRKIVIDDRMGRDAYDLITELGMGKMTVRANIKKNCKYDLISQTLGVI